MKDIRELTIENRDPRRRRSKILSGNAVRHTPGVRPPTLKEILKSTKDQYLEDILTRSEGNVSQAARYAGMDRSNFYQMILREGFDPNDFRSEDKKRKQKGRPQ